MMTTNTITAIEKLNFHGDELDLITTADGGHWVVFAGLCSHFDLRDAWGQSRKLRRSQWATTAILAVVANDGKIRDQVCLSIRSVAGWLFTLSEGKIAIRLRAKLAVYQREAADVLYRHFFERPTAIVQAQPADASLALAQITALTALVTKLADNVGDMQQRLATGHAFASGTVSPMTGNGIKRRLHVMGQRLAACKGAKNVASDRQKQTVHLRAVVGWPGRWNGLPVAKEADCMRELDAMERAVDTIAAVLNAGKQLVLAIDNTKRAA
jgi:hypothetical protein